MTRRLFACIACALALPASVHAQAVRQYITSKDTSDRLTEKEAFSLEKKTAAGAVTVSFNPSKTFQSIEGFGGAFTESAAVVLHKMSPENQKTIMNAYFGDQGIGYTVCRTHINSCDFSLGNYAYDETPGDTALKDFTIKHDQQDLLPMIKEAMKISKTPIKIFASPWSPPAWMKTNGKMNGGGELKPEYAQTWADYFARYIQEYKKEGVEIWGVTVQNEPAATQSWDSCRYTAEQERDFVRDHLGPTLEKAGMGNVKIMIWDHNRDLLIQRATVPFSDEKAAKYIWGAAIHWYAKDHFDQMDTVHEKFPDKAILFTEGCQESGPHNGDWKMGERYGHNVINDLNHWAVGWVDWNMVLDEKGGPNHVGNYCSAPILADTANDKVMIQSSFYYLGHFSRFIKPGAKRIESSTVGGKLEAAAFVNPDNSVVVVVMNDGARDQPFDLTTGEMNSTRTLPAHSIVTYVISK